MILSMISESGPDVCANSTALFLFLFFCNSLQRPLRIGRTGLVTPRPGPRISLSRRYSTRVVSVRKARRMRCRRQVQ